MSGNDIKTEDLKDIYGEHSDRYTDIDYKHPAGENMLIALKAILSECATGRHLLDVMGKLKLDIHLIKHDKIKGNVIDQKTILLAIPEEKTQIEPLMILELAAALREAEQSVLGYDNPDKDTDPLEFAAISHAKNLDIVVYMCKVAFELSQSSDSKTGYADALEDQGLGGIYDAYVRDFSSEEIVDTYYS